MKNNIPNWIDRQKSLYARDRKSDPKTLTEIGKTCLEAGRLQEALEYIFESKDQALLGQLEEVAIQEGDFFIVAGIEKLTSVLRPLSTWNRVGEQALKLGKIVFARKAFEKSQNQPMLDQIRTHDS